MTATQPGNNSFSSAQQVVRVVQVAEATSSNAGNPPQFGGSVPGAAPRPPGAQPGSSSPSKPSAAKVNAGSFKGYVALYAKGHKGKRFSAKVGKDWVIVPSLKSDFVRIVEYTGVGYRIAVRLFIDRNLVQTINLLTK